MPDGTKYSIIGVGKMDLLLEENSLRLLLEQKRRYIGRKELGIPDIIAGITTFISAYTAACKDYGFVSGNWIKHVLEIAGVGLVVWGIYAMIKNQKDNYSAEDLYQDMKQMNVIQHQFSIVVLKDTFHKFPNHYLLYYDERWNCRFFFNYKTQDNDEDNILNRLSNELHIKRDALSIQYCSSVIQRKYSVSHDEDRTYNHRLYRVDVKKYPELLKKTEFEIDGRKFYWMTLDEMEQDKDIQEKNLDVVHYIRDQIG